MKLFKRLLLSLFPKDMLQQGMHPASMFVSFISPKQFFSVITRKIVENYKLNLFDIALDPFEVKVGFGDEPALQVKDVDFYYGYGAAANMNWWQFYSPGNIAIGLCFATSVLVKDVFSKPYTRYLLSFLMTVYVLVFAFVGRIKVFPSAKREENIPRFIDLFFSTRENVAEIRWKKIPVSKMKLMREHLLQHIEVFFMLAAVYEHLNQLFSSPILSSTELYQWLFYDELKKWKQQVIVQDFINNADVYTKSTERTEKEHQLMQSLLPADILLRYLYTERDARLVTQKVISQVYDAEKLHQFVQSFLRTDEQFEDFLVYICDRRLLRSGYFSGIKKLAQQKFRVREDYAMSQEIDAFMSELQDTDSLEGVKVPEVLRQESLLMERLLNFYMTHVGGGRVGRGDTFFVRLFRKPLVHKLLTVYTSSGLKQDALYFYRGLLYNYSKNIFYYKYAFDNVKAGKEKFQLPFKSSFKEVYSNMYIIKLFDESFVNILIQDINKKPIKIYVSNPEMLTMFKHIVGDRLSQVFKEGPQGVIDAIYSPLSRNLSNFTEILQIFYNFFTVQDIGLLKENLYTVDLWMRRDAFQRCTDHYIKLSSFYNDMSIFGISALLRETMFGLLLFLVYAKKLHPESGPHILRMLKKVYIVDVLQMNEELALSMSEMIDALTIKYEPLLTNRVHLDDNEEYLWFWFQNRKSYCEWKEDTKIFGDLVGEDIIRFRGYLKTITYYNKRYFIPR